MSIKKKMVQAEHVLTYGIHTAIDLALAAGKEVVADVVQVPVNIVNKISDEVAKLKADAQAAEDAASLAETARAKAEKMFLDAMASQAPVPSGPLYGNH